MDAKIIKVGNSSGIILPSALLKTLGVGRGSSIQIEMRAKAKEIVIKPQTRAGWADAFQKYALEGEDDRLLPDVFEDEEF